MKEEIDGKEIKKKEIKEKDNQDHTAANAAIGRKRIEKLLIALWADMHGVTAEQVTTEQAAEMKFGKIPPDADMF